MSASSSSQLSTSARLPDPIRTVVAPLRPGVGPFTNTKGGIVTGSVAPGWEDLRLAFEQNYAENLERQSQLCIYKDGKPVVDLYGTALENHNDETYDADTLQNIFSTGKNLEAVVCMLLVDRGQLKYSDKVADHWPEFGKHGKAVITVEDVLRHESGLQFFADAEDPEDLKKVKIPKIEDIACAESGRSGSGVEKIIEDCAMSGYGKRMYHASTRGFIIGGLVRKITGQTLGQFISENICRPLEMSGLHCGAGLKQQENFRYAKKMEKASIGWTMTKEVLPSMLSFLPGMPETTNSETLPTFQQIGKAVMDSKHPLRGYPKSIPHEWEQNGDHVNVCTPEGRTLEVSSGSIQANARSLGKLAGAIANGGRLHESSSDSEWGRFISEETLHQAFGAIRRKKDAAWDMDIANTTGGFFDFGQMYELTGGLGVSEERRDKQKGFKGWPGKGGSLFVCNLEEKIGVGYTVTGMVNGASGGVRTEKFFELLGNK